jgi:SAM-dependent methyltransferase
MMSMTGPTFDTEWRARFERYGQRFEDEAFVSGWSKTGLERRLRLFESLLPELRLSTPADVLDLGCGAGTYVRRLASLGHHVVGLDYSIPSLRRAMCAARPREGHYLAGDAYGLPFRRDTFDLVVSIGVLQAVTRPEVVIDEMSRVLRPGGALVVEALNGKAFPALVTQAIDTVRKRPARVRRYSPRQVQRWLETRGFDLTRRAEVCLPPRWWPQGALAVAYGALAASLAHCRSLVLPMAHSFLFVARKPSDAIKGRP